LSSMPSIFLAAKPFEKTDMIEKIKNKFFIFKDS
jgi:hypothetical protein